VARRQDEPACAGAGRVAVPARAGGRLGDLDPRRDRHEPAALALRVRLHDAAAVVPDVGDLNHAALEVDATMVQTGRLAPAHAGADEQVDYGALGVRQLGAD